MSAAAAMAAVLAAPGPAMALGICVPVPQGLPGDFTRHVSLLMEPVGGAAPPRTGAATSIARAFGLNPPEPPPGPWAGTGHLARRSRVYLAAGGIGGLSDSVEAGRLDMGDLPFPLDWCLRTWPGHCALIASLPAGGPIGLEERLRILRDAWEAAGLELLMPPDGQDLLATLMAPDPAPLPEDAAWVHERAPRPIAGPGPDPLTSPGAFLLRVRRGPRRGVQVRIEGECVVGHGAADLDVDDPSASTRHATIRLAGGGAVMTLAGGSPSPLAPGEWFAVGGSEVVLLQAAGPCADRGDSSVEVSVVTEGAADSWSVAVAAGDASCGEVSAALAGYLGLPESTTGRCFYRAGDGRLLPDDLGWRDAGIERGDTLVVADLADVSAGCPTGPPDPSSRAGPPNRVAISRGPRTHRPPSAHRFNPPQVPDETTLRGAGYHWQIAASLGLGATAVVTGLALPGLRWLAFAGAVTSIFGALAAVMADRSRRRFQRRRFLGRIASLDGELAAIRSAQVRALHDCHPAPQPLREWVRQRGDRLWERRRVDADFLALRLGSGRRRALLEAGPSGAEPGPLAGHLTALQQRHAWLDEAPIVLPCRLSRVLGVSGLPDGARDGLVRWLILQAAALHAPADLAIGVVAGTPRWGWTRWLPHARRGGEALVSWDAAGADLLASELARRLQESSPAGGHTLLLIDHDVAGRPAVCALLGALRAKSEPRCTAIVLADDRCGLPSGTDANVSATPDGWELIGAGAEDGPVAFAAETLSVSESEALARAMAPLRESGAPAPTKVGGGLLDLAGWGPAEALPVERLWYGPRAAERLEVPIGVSDSGEVLTLGLRRDGPHGLIAGTTGAGKSELLQSILAGLALTHPPEVVSLLLIDYKGGAAFADLARLPHTVGTVTDLDERLAARALVSLNAELKRRETVLRQADAANIAQLERRGERGAQPLSNLVIAVDEFATLAQELPGFVDSLIDVAQRGRSLGVHLLLATQSPGGVVGPKIQANINYWMCLRVSLDSESTAVIGTNQAAAIPVNMPGRGYLRIGGRTEAFQTARIARPVPSRERLPVTVTPFADGRPAGARVPGAGAAPDVEETDLRVATLRVAAEARRLGIERPPSPWLPALPDCLARHEVADVARPSRLSAVLGLMDEPELQRQTPLLVDLEADGSCLLLGAYGSGTTSLLREAALDIACHNSAAEVHIYGLDGGDGSLAPLGALPHCADVVGADDPDRVARLLGRLTRLAAERRGTRGALPRILLLVDGYASIAGPLDYRQESAAEALAGLVRRGPAVGIHTVVAAQQRSDLPSATLGLFGRRLLLRQAEAADYDLAGLPPGGNGGGNRGGNRAEPPPGRGFISGAPAREFQVVWSTGPDRAFPPLPVAAGLAAAAHSVDPGACPRPVPAFPTEVLQASLPPLLPPGGAGCLVLGLGGAEVQPSVIDLDREGPHLLIAGPDRSGRSTALLTCLASLRAGEPESRIVILAPRPSPLRKVAGPTVATTAGEIEEALAGIRPGPTLLLADDCEALPPEAAFTLNGLLRSSREQGLQAIVAGRSADLLRLYDDWTRYLRSLRCGILLNPEEIDGELFDLRLPHTLPPRHPGRGYVVRGRHLDAVQIALPSVPAAPPPSRNRIVRLAVANL